MYRLITAVAVLSAVAGLVAHRGWAAASGFHATSDLRFKSGRRLHLFLGIIWAACECPDRSSLLAFLAHLVQILGRLLVDSLASYR